MFKIKFRIVDDIELLSSMSTKIFDDEYDQILGFFQINFGSHQEGSYYHENQLMEGEEGGELLDYWFDKILQVIISLDSEADYVAFKELETVNRWIDFTKKGDNVFINVAVDDTCQNNNSKKFLIELKHINPDLCKTKIYKALQQKIDIIQN